MKEVHLKAGQLSMVRTCFEALEGPRPISLSLKIAKLMAEVDAAWDLFREKIQPYIDDQGQINPDDNEVAMELVEEVVELEVPAITVAELEAAKLQVTNDSAVGFLLANSLISEA